MPVITFRCPHCAANLKIRDDQITGSPVACPDCRKPMLVTRDEFGNVAATAPAASPAKAAKSQKPPASGKTVGTATGKSQTPPIVREEPLDTVAQKQPPWKKLSRTATLWIGAAAAGVVAILVAGIVFWPRGSKSGSHAAETGDATLATAPVIDKSSPVASGRLARNNPAADAAQNGPKPSSVADRFGALGQRIAEYRVKKGRFPTAASGRDG
jgi:hypothetical protein